MSNGGAKFTLFQFVDDTGTPYASCKLFHYAAGTTTDKTIWTDEAKTTPAAQPIVADSKGIVTFYADGDYYFVLKDSSDNILYDTWDYVRITSDSATMWEGNHGTAYPSAAAANIWQLFAKHTAGNILQELGINNGSSFVPLVGIDTNLKYAADTGIADAYLIAPSPPITAYTAGQIFYMKATNANTGASTVNVNSLGIKSIKKDGSDALIANDILAGQIIALQYDGTNFQLMSPSGESVYEDATQTLTNKTLTSPTLSGTTTGTYTLAGTPTITSPTITSMAYTSSVKAGTSASTMKISGLLDSDANTISNSVGTETDLHSFTIPSGAIAGSYYGVRAVFFGDNANNANSKTIKLYVEGVEIFQMTSTTADAKWRVELTGVRNGSYLICNVIGIYGAAAPTSANIYINTPVGTTITLSGDVIVKITGQGVASNDIISYAAIVELLQD